VPSWDPEYEYDYNYGDNFDLEMVYEALKYNFGSLSATSDAKIGEYLHDLLFYMIPKKVELQVKGTSTVSRAREVSQEENYRITCEACSPLQSRLNMTA